VAYINEQNSPHPDLKKLYYTYLEIATVEARAEALAPKDINRQILAELKKISQALEKTT